MVMVRNVVQWRIQEIRQDDRFGKYNSLTDGSTLVTRMLG